MRIPQIKKPSKFAIMIVASIILASVAAYMSVHYLQTSEKALTSEFKKKAIKNTVLVVVPIRNLLPGTIANSSNMAARRVPRDVTYSETIFASDWNNYEGQVLTQSVEKGRPLLKNDFMKKITGDFASMMPKNMRAITIQVGGVNSLAGLIRPGDFIDVLLSATKLSGTEEVTSIIPILHRTLVLATGRHTKNSEAPHNINEIARNGENSYMSHYGTLTLEVTPKQAALLALATHLGTLRVVLTPGRNSPGSQKIPHLSSSEIMQKMVSGGAGVDSFTVQYIIGRGGSISTTMSSGGATSNNNNSLNTGKPMKKIKSLINLDKSILSENGRKLS